MTKAKWLPLRAYPEDMGMVSYLQLDPTKRLSIGRALGERYHLSNKSNSVVNVCVCVCVGGGGGGGGGCCKLTIKAFICSR